MPRHHINNIIGGDYIAMKNASENDLQDESDNIYYNVVIPNLQVSNQPTLAKFQETRSKGIIKNPNHYELSIVRFSVPANIIPLMIFPIQGGSTQNNINLSTLKICLTYNNIDYPENLIFTTENLTSPLPPAPSANPPNYNQVVNSFYYYVYSYQHFITMINTALSTAFSAIITANPADLYLATLSAPYLILNSQTQLCSLITNVGYINDDNPDPTVVEIYMNGPLFERYLDSIWSIFNGYNQTNGKDYKIRVANLNNNEYIVATEGAIGGQIVPPVTPEYIEMQQEFTTLQNWNSFVSLVFLTGTIPVNTEAIPPFNFIQQGTADIPESQNNSYPILTDFIPAFSRAGEARGLLVYYPTAEYRMVSLSGSTELRTFDVSVMWQDDQGRIHPVYIPYSQTLTIKFLFRKKIKYRQI